VEKTKEGNWELRGTIDYRFRNRKKSIHLNEDHLLNAARLESVTDIEALGPFKVLCYWFNRGRLRAIEGIGDSKAVKDLVARWGGKLMVFRDRLRVHSYGGPSDDCLGLDPVAFLSQGYKVNRKQIIGKVDITSADNPNCMTRQIAKAFEIPAKRRRWSFCYSISWASSDRS